MRENYKPPFTMTEEITNLVIEIGELVGAVATYDTLQPNPKLCRESRIRSIHSSLAIEQNTLTPDQVTDVIDGKMNNMFNKQAIMVMWGAVQIQLISKI
jgi:Fic family protein